MGQAIVNSGIFPCFLAPAEDELDITKPDSIERYFNQNEFDAVVHCAALARMSACQEDPVKAVKVNIIGTSNLVNALIAKEGRSNSNIRFVHISTDGVYAGTKGNYSEKDPAIPYNNYGWTKLGAECAVNLLSDFCVIRTSFFDPKKIKFDSSAGDAYSSKVTIDCLVRAILAALNSGFIGVINIGAKRESDYQRYRKFKPSLKRCRHADIARNINFKIAKDASLNSGLWRKIGRT